MSVGDHITIIQHEFLKESQGVLAGKPQEEEIAVI
jgi:hypothetical protein